MILTIIDQTTFFLQNFNRPVVWSSWFHLSYNDLVPRMETKSYVAQTPIGVCRSPSPPDLERPPLSPRESHRWTVGRNHHYTSFYSYSFSKYYGFFKLHHDYSPTLTKSWDICIYIYICQWVDRGIVEKSVEGEDTKPLLKEFREK